jgi:hypothetical protein
MGVEWFNVMAQPRGEIEGPGLGFAMCVYAGDRVDLKLCAFPLFFSILHTSGSFFAEAVTILVWIVCVSG